MKFKDFLKVAGNGEEIRVSFYSETGRCNLIKFKDFLKVAGSGEKIRVSFYSETGWKIFAKTIDFMYDESTKVYHDYNVIQINADNECAYSVILEGES